LLDQSTVSGEQIFSNHLQGSEKNNSENKQAKKREFCEKKMDGD